MENFYQNLIEESKLKQNLMELGIKVLMQESKPNLNVIGRAIQALEAEKQNQKYNEESLAQYISGEAQRKAEAKRKLGMV